MESSVIISMLYTFCLVLTSICVLGDVLTVAFCNSPLFIFLDLKSNTLLYWKRFENLFLEEDARNLSFLIF